VVVSGINAGLNTGRAVLHSGTVGAALTAQNVRMSALAVSLQESDPWHWDTGVTLTIEVLGMLLDGPPRSVLNLNVPARERSSVLGIRWARLAPFGEVRMALRGEDGERDPSGAITRRLSTELRLSEATFQPDTDTGLVRAGYATLTTLVGVAEAWPSSEQLAERAEPGRISTDRTPGAPLRETHQIPDADTPGNLRRPVSAD
jgi:5'-nucleotidase